MKIDFMIPGLRLESEPNTRGHWSTRARRAKEQRQVAWSYSRAFIPLGKLVFPCVVTITRLGPRMLDSDNLAASAKAVRDGVADALGIDDGGAAVEWRYRQEIQLKYRGSMPDARYSVRIQIAAPTPKFSPEAGRCPTR